MKLKVKVLLRKFQGNAQMVSESFESIRRNWDGSRSNVLNTKFRVTGKESRCQEIQQEKCLEDWHKLRIQKRERLQQWKPVQVKWHKEANGSIVMILWYKRFVSVAAETMSVCHEAETQYQAMIHGWITRQWCLTLKVELSWEIFGVCWRIQASSGVSASKWSTRPLKRLSCRWSTEVRRFQRMVSSQQEGVNRECVTGFVRSYGDWYLKKTKFQSQKEMSTGSVTGWFHQR